MEKMMNAVLIDAFGGPEVLHMKKIPIPVLGAGEVLVKIAAASVNPVDYKIRAGKYPSVTTEMLPYVLGRDVSGNVAACGPDVQHLKEGAALHALLPIGNGGYAEYVVVKETAATSKPTTLDHLSAAAVPLAGLTAWQGLFRYGGLQPGQRVLIHAGSGGVGHFAIQFAKALGIHVITTVSAPNADFVRQLGADEVIDYTTQQFENEVRNVDVVFDLIGGETQDRSWGVLRKGGVLVSTVSAPSQEKASAHQVRAVRYTAETDATELAEIGRLIDSGSVKPVVSKTFALKDAALAIQFVEQGHTQGKVVLSVDGKV